MKRVRFTSVVDNKEGGPFLDFMPAFVDLILRSQAARITAEKISRGSYIEGNFDGDLRRLSIGSAVILAAELDLVVDGALRARVLTPAENKRVFETFSLSADEYCGLRLVKAS